MSDLNAEPQSPQNRNLYPIKKKDESNQDVVISEYEDFAVKIVEDEKLKNKILRGDLSDDIKALQLNQRKVRVNNKNGYIDPSTIDNLEEANILEFYSSSFENNFNRNGQISEQGKLIYTGIFSKLRFLINELLEKIGIKSSTQDNRLWCRHLSVAFMTGLITLEELDNVKNPQDFEKLLTKIKVQNKDIVNKNKTILKFLEDEYRENRVVVEHGICINLFPPDYKPEYACLMKIVENISLLQPQIDLFSSVANEKFDIFTTTVNLVKDYMLLISLLAGEKKKNRINQLKSLIEKAEHEVKNLISDTLTPNGINTPETKMIHQQLQILKELKEEKNSELTTGRSKGKSIDNLEKYAVLLEKNNRKKDAKKIISIVKNGYFDSISQDDFDTIYNILIDNSQIVVDFLIDHTPNFFSFISSVHYNKETIPTSEDSLGDTLYSMCKAVIDSSDNSTASNSNRFIMQTFNHVMMLEIKYKNNKVYINFYDPNDTGIYKTIELASVEYVKQLSIKNFISDNSRVFYKIASKADIKNNSLSTKHGHIIFSRKKQSA